MCRLLMEEIVKIPAVENVIRFHSILRSSCVHHDFQLLLKNILAIFSM